MGKLKDTMPNILHKLQDPELVAAFQRLFGVVPIPQTGESTVQNGDVSKTVTKKAKSTNGISTGLSNGVVYKLRSRTVKTPPRVGVVRDNGDADISDSDSCSVSGSEVGRPDFPSDTDTAQSTDCDNNLVGYKITNRLFYYLFCIGAAIGNEIFYCIFFPSWFWNVDGYVCRRLVIIWTFIMYFGQATKDIVRLPRPSSPPVVKLEKRYELEYGMPSTHAMIGAAFPFSLLLLTMNRYVYLFKLAVAGAFFWCSVVCGSRLYMGMHSVLDITCGLLYAGFLVPLIWPFLDVIDNFQLHHPYAPFVMVGIPLFLALCYPTLDKWSTARGDTTLILGVLAGVAMGSWVNTQWDIYHNFGGNPPYFVKTPDALFISKMECRMILGAVILFATRFIAKACTFHLICYVLKIDKKCIKSRQRLIVELPYKFITYFTIAFNVIYTAPAIFRYLGIEKEVIFTEV